MDYIERYLREIGFEGVNWLEMAQSCAQWHARV
jgi:hypothetical protein